MSCRYVVGRDLEFSLHRVGEKSVVLAIARSDPEGEYFVESTMNSRCALVRYGKRGMAQGGSRFVIAAVSGRNGMVYRSMRECRVAR